MSTQACDVSDVIPGVISYDNTIVVPSFNKTVYTYNGKNLIKFFETTSYITAMAAIPTLNTLLVGTVNGQLITYSSSGEKGTTFDIAQNSKIPVRTISIFKIQKNNKFHVFISAGNKIVVLKLQQKEKLSITIVTSVHIPSEGWIKTIELLKKSWEFTVACGNDLYHLNLQEIADKIIPSIVKLHGFSGYIEGVIKTQEEFIVATTKSLATFKIIKEDTSITLEDERTLLNENISAITRWSNYLFFGVGNKVFKASIEDPSEHVLVHETYKPVVTYLKVIEDKETNNTTLVVVSTNFNNTKPQSRVEKVEILE